MMVCWGRIMFVTGTTFGFAERQGSQPGEKGGDGDNANQWPELYLAQGHDERLTSNAQGWRCQTID